MVKCINYIEKLLCMVIFLYNVYTFCIGINYKFCSEHNFLGVLIILVQKNLLYKYRRKFNLIGKPLLIMYSFAQNEQSLSK